MTSAPPDEGGILRHLPGALLRAARHYWHGDDSFRAAAIAYYGLLSFFPFVLLVGATSRLFVGDDPGQARLFLAGLRGFLPFLSDGFWQEVATLAAGSGAFSFASLLVLLLFASQVAAAIERALRLIFGAGPRRRGTLRQRAVAALRVPLTTSVGLLLIGGTFIARNFASYLDQVGFRGADALAVVLDRPIVWMRVLPALTVGLVAYLAYRRVPVVPAVRRRSAAVGALVFAFGQEAALLLYAAALASSTASADATYGPFVGLVMLVVWTYWLAAFLLFGGELVAELNGNRPPAE